MDKKLPINSKNAAVKMGLGISLGVILGLAFKNIAIGIVLGIILGGIGITLDKLKKGK